MLSRKAPIDIGSAVVDPFGDLLPLAERLGIARVVSFLHGLKTRYLIIDQQFILLSTCSRGSDFLDRIHV